MTGTYLRGSHARSEAVLLNHKLELYSFVEIETKGGKHAAENRQKAQAGKKVDSHSKEEGFSREATHKVLRELKSDSKVD